MGFPQDCDNQEKSSYLATFQGTVQKQQNEIYPSLSGKELIFFGLRDSFLINYICRH